MKEISKATLMDDVMGVYTRDRYHKLSEAYLIIPTIDIIEQMEKVGFVIDSGFQRKAQKDSQNNKYEVHVVRMLVPDLSTSFSINKSASEIYTITPGITLINAQNAKYPMTATACAKICTNDGKVAYMECPSVMSYTFSKVPPHTMTIESCSKMLDMFTNSNVIRQVKDLALKMARTKKVDTSKFLATAHIYRDPEKYQQHPIILNVPDPDINNMLDYYIFAFNILLVGNYYRTDDTGKQRKSQPLKDGLKEYEMIVHLIHELI